MPAGLRSVIAASAIAIACILHLCPDVHAAPKKPKVVQPKKGPKKVERVEKTEPVEKSEPPTAPAAAEPPPAPLPAPDPKKDAKDTRDAKEATPGKKDESPAASSSASASLGSSTTGPAKDKPALVPVPKSNTLEPGHVDLKATANADALLAFIGVGAAADIGVVRGGPGVFALGAAGEYDFCATVCWLFNAITPLEFSQRQISLWGRASYHIDIKGKSVEKIDVFPFIMLGPTFANASIKLDNGAAEYRGKDTALAGGVGLGANIFVAGPLFVGAEARFRYAQGVYQYELISGNQRVLEGSVYHWSTTGVDVLFAMGGRF